MEEEDVRVLVAVDGSRRVRIVRRRDLFAFIPERHYTEEADGQIIAEGWAPFPRVASFFSDAESAEEAARSRYSWLGS
jgi:hypothetical protein